MDPRTSAKVTATDLLEAFHEAAPKQDVVLDADLRVYLILADDNDVVLVNDYNFADMETALQRVRMHLQSGGERSAFIVSATSAPELFLETQKALSAKSD